MEHHNPLLTNLKSNHKFITIGEIMLRLDLLDRHGLKDELYDNIKGYFTYMADQTGTLWELVANQASCNHGFASHVIHWMNSLGLLAHE